MTSTITEEVDTSTFSDGIYLAIYSTNNNGTIIGVFSKAIGVVTVLGAPHIVGNSLSNITSVVGNIRFVADASLLDEGSWSIIRVR